MRNLISMVLVLAGCLVSRSSLANSFYFQFDSGKVPESTLVTVYLSNPEGLLPPPQLGTALAVLTSENSTSTTYKIDLDASVLEGQEDLKFTWTLPNGGKVTRSVDAGAGTANVICGIQECSGRAVFDIGVMFEEKIDIRTEGSKSQLEALTELLGVILPGVPLCDYVSCPGTDVCKPWNLEFTNVAVNSAGIRVISGSLTWVKDPNHPGKGYYEFYKVAGPCVFGFRSDCLCSANR